MRLALLLTLSFFAVGFTKADETPANIKPIIPLAKIKAKANVFETATRKKPLVIKSGREAAKYFDAAELKMLKKKVQFGRQIVLIFAWKGSGQDQMTYDVAESLPEQVKFKYKPGRTRDLRPHVKIYALRKNVKWSIGPAEKQP